ncbi:MAG: VOC family protein [Streptosporangiaceae bacterium]|jgi:predicted enzyme related to lactoylglutathione lyase
MRERDISAGAPCWVDLTTSDAETARGFYSGLFGWTANEAAPEFGGYFMFDGPGGVPVAGCMPAMADGPADVWSVYLTVDDIEKTLELVTASGGQVIVPAMQVGEAGTMGVALDPGGAGIGLWQPDQFGGTTQAGEPGLPSWFELHATNYDAQLAFYQSVFGWTGVEPPGMPFRYNILTHGEDTLAGIMEGGEDHTWSVYFWTADADAALARAAELGGTVIVPAEDTPYGRLATVADPNGARFKLMAPNAQMPAN